MEELLNYLIQQKEEREQRKAEYNQALRELEIIQRRLADFGDITLVDMEIKQLGKFIDEVSDKIGAVEYDGDEKA